MKKILIAFCFVAVTLSAEVAVEVSRTLVGMNESFSIEYSSDQRIKGQPDFSPLERDFDILSVSQGQNYSTINGVTSQKFSWHLEVIAKHEGKLVVPSISIGNASTQPLTVEVTAAHAVKRNDTLFLEAEIEPKKSVFEQTQLTYTVRLYRAVNVAQGTFSDLTLSDPDAIIEKLSNDTEYEVLNNGVRYIVLERKYAIFPQHAGELVFSPITFEGRVMTAGNSLFYVQTQYRRVSSNELKIDVKPIPAPFQKNNWLAAYDVKLEEGWSSEKVAVGEPITWTLTITADGCMGSQIPQLFLNLPADVKQYQDKPHIDNKMVGGKNIGIKEMKIAIIASKPGNIDLPEVTLQWWDLANDKIQESRLPGRTIRIDPGQVAMNDEIAFQKPIQDPSLPLWAWGLIGMNGIWVMGLLWYLARKIPFKLPKRDSFRTAKANLKEACQKNDPKSAEKHLIAWAAFVFPEMNLRTLMEIRQHVDFQEAIDDLYKCLYGNHKDWQGRQLQERASAFTYKKPKLAKSNENKILRDLYE